MVSTTLKSLLFGLLLAVTTLEATPHRIIVLTSGETSSTNTLTSKGQKRASALVGFLLGIPPNTPPLFADMVSKTSHAPAHPISFVGAPSTLSCIQTISPLADVISCVKAPISVFTNIPESVDQFFSQKIGQLQESLYKSKEHDGKTAVICTKSSDVPTLLIQLEPRMRHNSSFQKTFSSKATSNQAFVITYKKDKPTFQVLPIHL